MFAAAYGSKELPGREYVVECLRDDDAAPAALASRWERMGFRATNGLCKPAS
jgi:hypothetical protein